jgi:biotin synthase
MTTKLPLHSEISAQEIEGWLRSTDQAELSRLFLEADEVRKANVGDAVHLRGLIELSNYCVRGCTYCGLRAANRNVHRYRMNFDEVMTSVERIVECGFGTVVMQAGEDYGLTEEFIERIILEIKRTTELAITLSLGERPDRELKTWKNAGADRFLLRFETSDNTLYKHIHPNCRGIVSDRMAILKTLLDLGYETGTGVMVGIPNQTIQSIANDISLFRDLHMDMIGVGPYIEHDDTPLSSETPVSFDKLSMTRKVIALTRIVRPLSNIPATTALETLDPVNGVEMALKGGANIIMPNLTSEQYKGNYQIYPGKADIAQSKWRSLTELPKALGVIGRTVGTGAGHSPSAQRKLLARKT